MSSHVLRSSNLLQVFKFNAVIVPSFGVQFCNTCNKSGINGLLESGFTGLRMCIWSDTLILLSEPQARQNSVIGGSRSISRSRNNEDKIRIMRVKLWHVSTCRQRWLALLTDSDVTSVTRWRHCCHGDVDSNWRHAAEYHLWRCICCCRRWLRRYLSVNKENDSTMINRQTSL